MYRPEEGIAGFHLENLKGVKMRNCEVIWKAKAPWYKNAVWAKGCEGLSLGVEVGGEAAEEVLRAIVVA